MKLNAIFETIGKLSVMGFRCGYLRFITFTYIDNNQDLFMNLSNGRFIEISSGLNSAKDNGFE